MSRGADLFELAAPHAGEFPCTIEGKIGIVAAGHDCGWKGQQALRNRREIFYWLGEIVSVGIRRGDQQGSFDLAGQLRRRLRPVGHGDASQAVSGKDDGRRRTADFLCDTVDPIFVPRRVPIRLLHANTDRALLLPDRLPVLWSGVVPAWQDKNALSGFPFAQLKLVRALELVTQSRGAQVFTDMRQPLLQRTQCLLDVGLVRLREIAPKSVWAGRNARHLAQGAPADGM